MLQTRSGKRTAAAALKIAVEMASEGLIDHEEAIKRIDPMALDQLCTRHWTPRRCATSSPAGLPASPGAASGKIVFKASQAEQMAQAGEKVNPVPDETSPGIFTACACRPGHPDKRGGQA